MGVRNGCRLRGASGGLRESVGATPSAKPREPAKGPTEVLGPARGIARAESGYGKEGRLSRGIFGRLSSGMWAEGFDRAMKLKVVIREAEERGFWAQVPFIPGCATQGDTFKELLGNIYETVEGFLSVEVQELPLSGTERLIEIAV